jgi:hypothetical protein
MAKSAQDRRVYTPSTSGAVCDRRPGHSSYRTVGGVDRPDHPGTTGRAGRWARSTPRRHRRRADLPGRGPRPAALQRRAPLAAGRTLPGRAPVPPAAVPARLQPPAARQRRADGGCPALAGRPHPSQQRAVAAAGWHPGGGWPLADDRHPLGLAGWAGYGHDTWHHCFYWGSRLLLVTTPDGTVTGFGLANPKLVGEREAAVAMLGGSRPPAGTGHAAGGRQGLCRPSVPDRAGRPGAWHLGSRSQRRTRPGGLSELAATAVEAIIWTSSTSSAWTGTAVASRPGCGRASCSACSLSTPRSGSTGRSAPRPSAP